MVSDEGKKLQEALLAMPLVPPDAIPPQQFGEFVRRFAQLVGEFGEIKDKFNRFTKGGQVRGFQIRAVQASVKRAEAILDSLRENIPTKAQLAEINELLTERGRRKWLMSKLLIVIGIASGWFVAVWAIRAPIWAAFKALLSL